MLTVKRDKNCLSHCNNVYNHLTTKHDYLKFSPNGYYLAIGTFIDIKNYSLTAINIHKVKLGILKSEFTALFYIDTTSKIHWFGENQLIAYCNKYLQIYDVNGTKIKQMNLPNINFKVDQISVSFDYKYILFWGYTDITLKDYNAIVYQLADSKLLIMPLDFKIYKDNWYLGTDYFVLVNHKKIYLYNAASNKKILFPTTGTVEIFTISQDMNYYACIINKKLYLRDCKNEITVAYKLSKTTYTCEIQFNTSSFRIKEYSLKNQIQIRYFNLRSLKLIMSIKSDNLDFDTHLKDTIITNHDFDKNIISIIHVYCDHKINDEVLVNNLNMPLDICGIIKSFINCDLFESFKKHHLVN